jgi:hypothetical protein
VTVVAPRLNVGVARLGSGAATLNWTVCVTAPSGLEASNVMLTVPTSLAAGVYVTTPDLGLIDTVAGPERTENVSGLPLTRSESWVVRPAVALTAPDHSAPLLSRKVFGPLGKLGAIHVSAVAAAEYGDWPVEFSAVTT